MARYTGRRKRRAFCRSDVVLWVVLIAALLLVGKAVTG